MNTGSSDAIFISNSLSIPLSQLAFSATRSQGAGGQNVNKVATAIYLRFDLNNSDLPHRVKQKLLESGDTRITQAGEVVIRAQNFRTQEQNKRDAIDRFKKLIQQANHIPIARRATKPTRSSVRKRLDSKTKHSSKKSLRKNVGFD